MPVEFYPYLLVKYFFSDAGLLITRLDMVNVNNKLIIKKVNCFDVIGKNRFFTLKSVIIKLS